jgi:hypothetical protein
MRLDVCADGGGAPVAVLSESHHSGLQSADVADLARVDLGPAHAVDALKRHHRCLAAEVVVHLLAHERRVQRLLPRRRYRKECNALRILDAGL